MDSTGLRALREQFRARMQARDFCIGEQEVERFFRELLGEPEPEPEALPSTSSLTTVQVNTALVAAYNMMHEHFDRVMNEPSPLMALLKRR